MITKNFFLQVLLLLVFLIPPFQNAQAKPRASMKFATTRAENPKGIKERVAVPYAFPSESMGTTIGVGAMAKGYWQDQLLFAGTVLGSSDSAAVVVLGMWDYLLPGTERFFFTTFGSLGYYPRQRAYTDPIGDTGIPSGDNYSDEDDFIEDSGNDNWIEFKLEYVLPIGSMKNSGMANYKLKNGLLESGASGGEIWNPLKSGATVLLLRQFNRFQSYETDTGDFEGTIHPVEVGLYYNNTDFSSNPSTGSTQYISLTHDFGWGESEKEWTFLEFEASKYFSFGSSDKARQRVLALNFWTGNSPSWEESVDENGSIVVSDNPPFNEGGRLGGFYRLRAYPNNRFNDKAVIYTTAEYRYTPNWNPIGKISWLKFLKMDWMQFVGFVEGGRVADEYDVSELFSDWKTDIGLGIRAMVAGGVVRLDMAASEDGSAAWVMFGHPF